MRPATLKVGLVSPRSTCDSMGAETPLRSASSRSDNPMASRSACNRGPMEWSGAEPLPLAIAAYVITYICIGLDGWTSRLAPRRAPGGGVMHIDHEMDG